MIEKMVKRTVILRFTLPGIESRSSGVMSEGGGSHSPKYQLKSPEWPDRENWTIELDEKVALDTADRFAALAKAIREEFEGK